MSDKPCTMGVGCDEYGVCYAAAHGEPERCPHFESLDNLNEINYIETNLQKRKEPPMTRPSILNSPKALELEEQIPGTLKFVAAVAKGLAVNTANGTISLETGLDLLDAFRDAWIAINAPAAPTTLADTLENITIQ